MKNTPVVKMWESRFVVDDEELMVKERPDYHNRKDTYDL